MRNRHTLRTVWKKYYGVMYLLIFATLALQFSLTEQLVVPKYWVSTPLDAYIPYLPVFVIPYTLWFVYIAVGLAYLMLTDQKLFIKTQWYLYVGYEFALLVCLIFPHGQLLRPENIGDVQAHPGIFNDIVRSLYSTDTNTNCLPSIHVLNQLAIHFGLCHSTLFKEHRWVKHTSLVFSILVCASTCFIKQHSILDVVAALPVSWVCHRLVFGTDWKALKNKVFKKKAPTTE